MTACYSEGEIKALSDPLWRLNHLYYITDKKGKRIKFKLNWAQSELFTNMWFRNIILKARQLGMSTFLGILFLDLCLFNPNVSAGIIAHTREDTEKLFRRIKYAYDNLPDKIKSHRVATIDSAHELKFANGSIISVGTSMRSATLSYLHISEFGKICAKYPEKAREIITGSLETVAIGQYVFIESTAEGSGGYFYEMCKKAQVIEKRKIPLTELDYRFHFFPWWKEPTYVIPEYVEPSKELKEYFESIDAIGIRLSGAQQAFYVKKYEVLEDDILREYPSTPDEAFRGSASGLIYGRQLMQCRVDKRIGYVPYDPKLLVHTAFDLGYNHTTAVWYFQIANDSSIRVIDFHQESNLSLSDHIRIVKSKPYTFGEHLAPHDIKRDDYGSGVSWLATAQDLGINFIVVEKIKVIEGIDQVKGMFPRCIFDEKKCEEGLRMLDNYRYEWDERLARWSRVPIDDYAADAADAFRYMATGLSKIDKSGADGNDKALAQYFRG